MTEILLVMFVFVRKRTEYYLRRHNLPDKMLR